MDVLSVRLAVGVPAGSELELEVEARWASRRGVQMTLLRRQQNAMEMRKAPTPRGPASS